jgi:hypothetical protein
MGTAHRPTIALVSAINRISRRLRRTVRELMAPHFLLVTCDLHCILMQAGSKCPVASDHAARYVTHMNFDQRVGLRDA